MPAWLQALRELFFPDLVPLPGVPPDPSGPALPLLQALAWDLCARPGAGEPPPILLPLALSQGLLAWQAGSSGPLRDRLDHLLPAPDPLAEALACVAWPPALRPAQALWSGMPQSPDSRWQAALDQLALPYQPLDFDAPDALQAVTAWGDQHLPGQPLLSGLSGWLALTQTLRSAFSPPVSPPLPAQMDYFPKPGRRLHVSQHRLMVAGHTWQAGDHSHLYWTDARSRLGLLLSWTSSGATVPDLPLWPLAGPKAPARLLNLELPPCRIQGRVILDPWLQTAWDLTPLYTPPGHLAATGLGEAWLGSWVQALDLDLTPWLQAQGVHNYFRFYRQTAEQTLRLDQPAWLTLIAPDQGLPLLRAYWQVPSSDE